jgi:hypothetical protein
MARTKKTIEIILEGENQTGKALKEAEKGLGQLEKEVKKTEKAFGAMDIAVGNIAANIVTSLGGMAFDALSSNIGAAAEASEVLQKQFDDLSGANLQAVAEDALYLQNAFGMDMQNSVNAADRVMQQFGGTAEEAFEALRTGAQMNLDRFGDLSDTLNEYSQDFADVGLTAQETMAIINSGLEAGARNTDVIGDAFNEFGIRLKDPAIYDSIKELDSGLGELIDAFQYGEIDQATAFSRIRDELLAMEDPIKRNALGVELFGTKWEDMGDQAALAMLETSQALDNGTLSVEQMTASNATLGQSIAMIQSSIQAAFVPALTELANAIAPIIAEYAPILSEWLGENIPASIAALQSAIEFLKPVIDAMKMAFQATWQVLKVGMEVTDLLIGVFVNLAAVAQGAISPAQALENVMGDVGDIIRQVDQATGGLISRIQSLGSGMSNAVSIATRLASALTAVGSVTGAARTAANVVANIAGRAEGGPVSAGTPYVVGERGPELIIPSRSGVVVPNNQMNRGSYTLNAPININGNADGNVVDQIESVLQSSLNRLVQQGRFS